ncbi:stage II sporulation protein P [Clostridium sp. D2Q-11]|uniref:Stage II sporulation protein P n=1 Tax=Anaeromonas frigoriresistens TaxID=2683708 RepID=A0A942UU82_9FIRM|nr:stage II sporulation protein P [Anaeromonas frigoriresistens]MBS4536869.1 stage II sporulation protein P [Anaeromonas frigoriresistens]
MRVYYIKDRSIIYILTAIICLVIIFIGVKIISNLQSEETTQKTVDVVEVFTGNKENSIVIDESEDNIEYQSIEEPNFFMMVLGKSNAFIRSIYNEKYKNSDLLSRLKQTYMIDLEIDQKILKTQLPAIVSMTNFDNVKLGNRLSIANRSSNKANSYEELETFNELEVESGYSPLGNIAFVDDKYEEAIPTSAAGISRDEAMKAIESMAKPKAISVESNKPYVMIYHTHATEAYAPVSGARSEDKKYNVVGIGDMISEELNKRGHEVNHVENYHDQPSYTGSYGRSLSTIKSQLKKEKNLKVLIDVHRDGVASDASYYDKAKKESVIEIDGKRVATFFMVVGNDTPNRDKIVQFSNYIKTVSDMLYPGLCRKPVMKPYGKFNQYMSDYTLLIEVGSNLNTIEETRETAKLIGEVLDIALRGITQ